MSHRDPHFSAASARSARKRALVAEDGEICRIVARQILERRGFVVDFATSGREAVAMSERERYSIILMDCRMPELDGYRAAAAIRERTTSPAAVPIIAMTVDGGDRNRADCLAAGMDELLAKPLSGADLDRVLARLEPIAVPEGNAPEPTAGATLPSGGDGTELVPLISAETAAEILADGGLENGLLELFVSSTRKRLEELSQALDDPGADPERAARLVHSLKGSCATFGATRMAAAAAACSVVGPAATLTALRDLLALTEPALRLLAAGLDR